MEHEHFIARRRARFVGIDGRVNIPYGTVLSNQGCFLIHQNKRVCTVSSQNALDYFVQDDDGAGDLRGKLVDSIQRCLERRDAAYQTRWDKVWASALCQKYRRPESEDYWLWARAFFDTRQARALKFGRCQCRKCFLAHKLLLPSGTCAHQWLYILASTLLIPHYPAVRSRPRPSRSASACHQSCVSTHRRAFQMRQSCRSS